jgi:hypothetical protein
LAPHFLKTDLDIKDKIHLQFFGIFCPYDSRTQLCWKKIWFMGGLLMAISAKFAERAWMTCESTLKRSSINHNSLDMRVFYYHTYDLYGHKILKKWIHMSNQFWLKLWQNKKGPIFVVMWCCDDVFFSAASYKKDLIFLSMTTNIRPFLFR